MVPSSGPSTHPMRPGSEGWSIRVGDGVTGSQDAWDPHGVAAAVVVGYENSNSSRQSPLYLEEAALLPSDINAIVSLQKSCSLTSCSSPCCQEGDVF